MAPEKKQERGQSLVEFALVVPLLLLIVMGVFDLGRAIYYYNAISGSAREAARRSIVCGGATGPTDCSATDNASKAAVVTQAVAVPITTSDITISPTSRKYGDTLTVTITITFQPLTFLIVGGVNFPISARTTMIVE